MQEEIDYRIRVLRPKLIADVQTALADEALARVGAEGGDDAHFHLPAQFLMKNDEGR